MRSLEINEFIERIDEMIRLVIEEGETIEIIKQSLSAVDAVHDVRREL